jgi:hypothetical protein
MLLGGKGSARSAEAGARRKSMAWIHVRHRVEDYSKWKEGFDSTADFKRSHGWKGYRRFAVEGDNTNVFVMEEFETAEQAHEFLGSDYLREAPRSGIMLLGGKGDPLGALGRSRRQSMPHHLLRF